MLYTFLQVKKDFGCSGWLVGYLVLYRQGKADYMYDDSYEKDQKQQGLGKLLHGKWGALIILAALVLVSVILQSGPGVSLDFGDTAMTLEIPDMETVSIFYEDMESIEYVESPDYGSPVSGTEGRKYTYGMWENSAWGTYCLAVYTKVDCCVVVHTEKGAYAFNLEEADATAALYQALLELAAQRP